ncbi:MAG: ABC transporter substrate-binding protein, partial [Candidatus Rokubacteria bacterium]|nr:ABC transporter substrate-binding protein [Candidatus Rokubacteria bacterium]
MPRPCRRALPLALLLTAAWMTAASPALAGPPTDRLREFFAKVNVVLRDPATEDRPLERVARIRRLVHDVADMRAAAATAFGPAWESRSAAERDEFTAVFGEMIERAYVGRLAGVARGGGGVAPVYLGEVVTNDDATVSSVLRGSGHEVRVDYRMTQHGARWRVRDIVLDGVSTVDNYRAQFRRLMQDGSHATLVAHMRAKLAEESYFFARVEVPRSAAAAPPPPPAAPVAAAPRVDDLEARVAPLIEWQPAPSPQRPAASDAPVGPRVTPSSPPAS